MSDDISKATVRGSAVFPSMRISGQARSGPLQVGGSADLKSDEAYEGPYEITPSTETQVMETARKKLAQNIVIDPVEAPTLQTKSVTPTESAQEITADVGYDGLEEVDVAAIASDYVGSAIDRRSGSDLSASGRTVTVPKGFYAAQQTKSVQQGTEGTPTATKSAVSNHAVTVTPSVTNQEGYIAGGTKNGSGVTVQASELVSGKKTISENGTDIDVTEYEKVDVQVPGGGSSKNTQVVQGTTRTTSSTQTAIGAEMTVSKSGTYDIYWSAFRSNTSSTYTYGTQLYVGGAAYGSENTTWTNHVQNNHLKSVSLTANQKLRVYGRNSRGSSYYIYAPTLVIVEN